MKQKTYKDVAAILDPFVAENHGESLKHDNPKTQAERTAKRTRHVLRYWSARFRRELERPDIKADGAPKGLKAVLEAQPSFQFCGGWSQYQVKWDWTRVVPHVIIPLQTPLAELWKKECWENAKDLPEELVKEVQRRMQQLRPKEEVIFDAKLTKGGSGAAEVTKRGKPDADGDLRHDEQAGQA